MKWSCLITMVGNQFPRFVFVIVFLLVFAMAARTPLDSDMWWHLRAGEEMLRTKSVLTEDLFSHTRLGEAWINHSWLAQIVMFLLYSKGGFLLLAAGVSLLATVSMGLVYAQMDGHPLMRAFVIILAVPVTAPVWTPRPQLVSLALFSLVGYLLFQYKSNRRNILWLLPVIFLFWSNLHGGYVLGLLLILTVILGEILNHVLGFNPGNGTETGVNPSSQTMGWVQIGRLLTRGVLAGLIVVVNPNGLAMWAIPFKTVGVEVLREFISEWASPDFHEIVQQPFLWMLIVLFGLVGFSGRRLDGSEFASIAVFAYLAFLARRNFGPFALVCAPVLARHLNAAIIHWWTRAGSQLESSFPWLSHSRSIRPVVPPVRRINRYINAALLMILMFGTAWKLLYVTSQPVVTQFVNDLFPLQAVRWIQTNHPPGHLFNEYNWGGYLIWELRDYPVFIDGRTDLFDDLLLRQYLQAISGEDGWEKVLAHYDINIVLLERRTGLARELARSPDWLIGYQDDLAVVFLKTDT